MTSGQTLICTLPQRGGTRSPAKATPQPVPPGRTPRVARLMALAIRADELLRQGALADYVALARHGHVSRARISQIMNLVYLAPDIQEEILFLPKVLRGRDPIHLRHLQPIARLLDWSQQRVRWQQWKAARRCHTL